MDPEQFDPYQGGQMTQAGEPPGSPGPQQMMQDPMPVTQSDQLEIQKLNQGLSKVRQELYSGEIEPDMAQDITQEIEQRRAPLMQRMNQAKQQGEQEQQQQMLRTHAQGQAMQHQATQHTSQKFQELVAEVIHPMTGETVLFYPDGKGGYSPIEFPSQMTQGEGGAAGVGMAGMMNLGMAGQAMGAMPMTQQQPQAQQPREQIDPAEQAQVMTHLPELTPAPARTPQAEFPEQPPPEIEFPEFPGAAEQQAAPPKPSSHREEEARFAKLAKDALLPSYRRIWEAHAKHHKKLANKEEGPLSSGDNQWNPVGEFSATPAQQAVEKAYQDREQVDQETYQKALADTKAQQQGRPRDPEVSQAEIMELGRQATVLAQRQGNPRAAPVIFNSLLDNLKRKRTQEELFYRQQQSQLSRETMQEQREEAKEQRQDKREEAKAQRDEKREEAQARRQQEKEETAERRAQAAEEREQKKFDRDQAEKEEKQFLDRVGRHYDKLQAEAQKWQARIDKLEAPEDSMPAHLKDDEAMHAKALEKAAREYKALGRKVPGAKEAEAPKEAPAPAQPAPEAPKDKAKSAAAKALDEAQKAFEARSK